MALVAGHWREMRARAQQEEAVGCQGQEGWNHESGERGS